MTGDSMSASYQQTVVDQLRQRISACMQRRGELEGTRVSPAGAAAVADQIRRLDGDIAEAARALYDAERKLKDGP
jgi:hypothetical protein